MFILWGLLGLRVQEIASQVPLRKLSKEAEGGVRLHHFSSKSR